MNLTCTEEGSNCGDNRVCVNKVCTCQSNYLLFGDTCKTVAQNMGSGCEHTLQCTYLLGDNTICSDNQCSCNSDTVLVANTCWEKNVSIGYNSTCETGPDCTATLGDGGTCEDGRCLCQEEFYYTTGRCLYVIGQLGDECNLDTQVCRLEADGDNQHVDCVSGICECESAYSPSQNDTRCVGAAAQLVASLACLMVTIASVVLQLRTY